MAEIAKSVDSLMCLREVASWYDPAVRQALLNGDMEHVALQRFTLIRPTLRCVAGMLS
jgi:hypothetical protein